MAMDFDEIERRGREFRRAKNLDARHQELLRLLDEAMAAWKRLDARLTEHLRQEADDHAREYDLE